MNDVNFDKFNENCVKNLFVFMSVDLQVTTNDSKTLNNRVIIIVYHLVTNNYEL